MVYVNGVRPTTCPTTDGGCGRPWWPGTRYVGKVPESEWEQARCQLCRATGEWGDRLVPPGTILTCPRCSNESNDYGVPHEFALDDGLPPNELGNGQRFVERFHNEFRYVPNYQQGEWFVYDGGRWRPDADLGAERASKEIHLLLMGRATAALREVDKDDKVAVKRAKRALDHAVASGTVSSLRRTLDAAASDPRIVRTYEDFDAHPFLFNARNGVIDLQTGNLEPHDPDLYLTRRSDVPYDPEAQCPTFLAFLAEIMGGKAHLVDFLQRAFGSTLVGVNLWEVLYIFWGSGRNGKTTLINAIAHVLGNNDTNGYAAAADPTTFGEERARTPGPREDLARLCGLRFVSVLETGPTGRLDGATVKRATSRDPIPCRFLFQRKQFQYVPQYKVFFATNHKPSIDGADFAMTRRVRLIPFTYTCPPEKVDTDLPRKLEAEASGILAWMVRGARQALQAGLQEPPEVVEATRDYADEQDDLAPFLTQCTRGPLAAAAEEGRMVRVQRVLSAVSELQEVAEGRPRGADYDAVVARSAGPDASVAKSDVEWLLARGALVEAPFLGRLTLGVQAPVALGSPEVEAKVPLQDLYRAYVAWARRNEIRPMGNRTFSARIRMKGLDVQRGGSNGARVVVGITLNAHGEQFLDPTAARRPDPTTQGFPNL